MTDTPNQTSIVAGTEVDVWDDRDPVERKIVVFVCEHVIILEDGSYYLPPFDKLSPPEGTYGMTDARSETIPVEWNRECVICGHKWLGGEEDDCPREDRHARVMTGTPNRTAEAEDANP